MIWLSPEGFSNKNTTRKTASRHEKKDFRGIWKHTKKLNPKPSIPVSVGGVSSPGEIANLFMEHFNIQIPLESDVNSKCFTAGAVISEVPARITAKKISLII